jgi:hypothetical protein
MVTHIQVDSPRSTVDPASPSNTLSKYQDTSSPSAAVKAINENVDISQYHQIVKSKDGTSRGSSRSDSYSSVKEDINGGSHC